jgi:hypothetical protein
MPRIAQEEPYRVLIAVELGADWPRWMSEQVAGKRRRVAAQAEGESPETFIERVLSIARGCQRHGGLESAVVLCNERTDISQQAARRQLLSTLPRSFRGRNKNLTLAASVTAAERLRGALQTLSAEVDSKSRAPLLRVESSAAPATSARASSR